MNLDSCTPGQRESVRRVDGPLLVSAGAGSGKTFTLTQRIAYALLPESGPAAGGIDEVLAITFTEKAAAEIKARVKRTLRAEGMCEEALKVDAAWISTIHGMCARILRTHALELGLDPAFGIVGDAERADLVAASIDEALGADNDIIERGSYGALFDEFPARSALPSAPSVASMLQALLDKAVGLRGGLDAVELGPEPPAATVLARELLLAYEDVAGALEQGGKSAAAERARAQAADAAGALSAFVAGRPDAGLRDLAAVVDGCAFLPKTFGGPDVKERVAAYQEVHAHVCRSLALGLAWPRMAELMALARDVAGRYEGKKRALCKLDNDDLLVRTLAAFEEHPDVAGRYADRFKLVMVDEFQDTSQLQIDLVSHLAGPGLARLCTVGDAQQSIYRFRGADVNVYEAHKRTMRSDEVGALYVELAKNFRSHADVLAFVDRVFEQPHVFGDGFMSSSRGAPVDVPRRRAAHRPRAGRAPAGRGTGVGVDDAKAACARAIARRFAALRACGHAPGDMVVLLGKMSRAETYAQALRDEGFECAVTGGSLFAAAPEVRMVARFVEALANPANTAALFEVLTSDLVRLSADDLLELATERDDETGELRRRDLDKGFARLAERTEELPPRLAHAVRLLACAQRDARTRPLSRVVRDAIVRSGWMARLEGQGAAGLARAANVLKAVRLIEQLEGERGLGLASAARAFAAELAAGMKEAPGALSGSGGDVVKIMTIHASKGLEFPHRGRGGLRQPGAAAGQARRRRAARPRMPRSRRAVRWTPSLGVAKRAAAPAASEDEEDADLAAARRVCWRAPPRATAGARRHAPRTLPRGAARARGGRGAGRGAPQAVRGAHPGERGAGRGHGREEAPAAGKPPAYPALVDDVRSSAPAARLTSGGRGPAGVRRQRARALRAHRRAGGGRRARRCRSRCAGEGTSCGSGASCAPFFVPRMAGF